ncbi:DUF418 domain-containing protein [Paenibacillus macquariensis]|uniref:DUF418 domain-containing protein n=1 Tax=Paenibacillus macquariensis TaxID=948756 RepID=A0ABY1K8S2_9BACL|nr:DUF418 domain-containing protein [Paenibacillus macquariensis]MEC0093354.1 DUF418 domain-containing protein [Paenibacillus macquariensis]OAB27491.1 hypothetical protein PMSM_24775 [Paenibacillus macquariensis subsp. macquariensis]SIR42397.1 uncharacterized protein SAMN05421578_113134 [Paenibacillus macquariensis]
MNPSIPQKQRIISLDIIRGLALFGIMFINVRGYMLIMEGTLILDYSGVNGVIKTLIAMFVEKKFFSIFSFLFGVGFYIFASRAEKRGDRPRWRFTRRLIALFVIGIIHVLFFWGSILAIYAVVGLLLLPFYRAQVATISKWLGGIIGIYLLSLLTKITFGGAGALTGVLEFIISDVTLIFIMFLAGFLAAKADWIRRISDLRKKIKWIQMSMLPICIGCSIWIWVAFQSGAENLPQIIALGTIPMVILYLTTMFTVLENEKVQHFFMPVSRVGQMALTNYVAQSFIGLAIISFMNLEVVSPIHAVIISTLIFALQIVYSVVWFKFFKMGPLERVWRFMTYGRNGRVRINTVIPTKDN